MIQNWTPELLTFAVDEHVYQYDNVKVPSATQIMELAGITKRYDGDPWYGERGTLVHLACHFLDEGTLNWASIDDEITPFVRAYADWREAHKDWRVEWSETPAYNPKLGYACTPDRVFALYNPSHPNGGFAVVDLKTGQKSRATGVQTALQAMCWKWSPMPERYALHLALPPDKMLVPYTDPDDYNAARGAVAVAKWRLKTMRKWPEEGGEE